VEFAVGLCVLVSLVALGLSWRVAYFCARSLPVEQVRLVDDLQREVKRQATDLADVQGKVAGWRVEIENLLTQVDDSLELTERKRRSMAASAAKIAAKEPNGPEQSHLTVRQQLEARARAQGLL